MINQLLRLTLALKNYLILRNLSHNTSVFLNFLYVDNFVEFASSVAFFYVMQVGGCQSQLEDLVGWAW
jgi:hypothetical protein